MPDGLELEHPEHISAHREVGSAVSVCKPKKVKVTLVELVEVVTRGDEGIVVGPAPAGSKPTKVTRIDQSGAAYKQYINLRKEIEGADKLHPEHGGWVDFKARVTVTGGPLSGRRVRFSYTLTPGARRPSGMTFPVAEGYDGGDKRTTTAVTDDEGWTGVVSFYLSQYAGDQFTISAEAVDTPGARKTTGHYEVWRKFWYQKTRATDHVVPEPTLSVAAYRKVFADMLATPEVLFNKAGAPPSTFYPNWMVEAGGTDEEQSVIGGHNRTEFYKKFNPKPEEPVKGHLIMCQHQWDPAKVDSDLLTIKVTSNPSQELEMVLDGGAWNAGILKPPLSGDLVVTGAWSGDGKSGALTADNVLLEKDRGGLNAVKVRLPNDAPDPTKVEVTVQLKVRFGKFFAGESNVHQMLIVHRGSTKQFNQVVSHEFGHGFGQTPRTGEQTPPLRRHAKQYSDEKGGQGSHCSTDATLVNDSSTTSGKRFTNGTCIMFHQVNPAGCKQVFCDVCVPHLRLRDFSALT